MLDFPDDRAYRLSVSTKQQQFNHHQPIFYSSTIEPVNHLIKPNSINYLQQNRTNSYVPNSVFSGNKQNNVRRSVLSRMTVPKLSQSSVREIKFQDSNHNRPKKQSKEIREIPQSKICCVLNVAILILLLGFVIFSISKHNKYPFSSNSLNYYLNHPAQVLDSKLNLALLLYKKSNNFSQAQNNYSNFDNQNISLINKLNSTQQTQSQLSDIRESKNTLSVDQTKQDFNQNSSLLNQCKQGQYFLKGRCIKCPQKSSWNGNQCSKNIDSSENNEHPQQNSFWNFNRLWN